MCSRDTVVEAAKRCPNEPCSGTTGQVQKAFCARSTKSQVTERPPNRLSTLNRHLYISYCVFRGRRRYAIRTTQYATAFDERMQETAHNLQITIDTVLPRHRLQVKGNPNVLGFPVSRRAGERLDAGARPERRARLVERNVPGAPMPRICRSMPPAVRVHVVGHAVGNVHLTRIHVHVVEESRPHVVAIALFVLGGKPHLLVQVERGEL